MKKRYRVLFLGLSGDEQTFRSRMIYLGVPEEKEDRMISRSPLILKQGLSLEFSLRYANAVEDAGGIVEILEYVENGDPIGHAISVASFKDFTMCPECGLKQRKRHACVRCGNKLPGTESGPGSEYVSGN